MLHFALYVIIIEFGLGRGEGEVSQPLSWQLVSQPDSHSAVSRQSVGQTVSQPARQSVSQSIGSQSVSQSVSKPVIQSVSQSKQQVTPLISQPSGSPR